MGILHESISLGVLTLTASIAAGPIINVRVRGSAGDVGTLHLSLAEWTSLRCLVDVLAAADRRQVRDRAELDVLKQECRELTEQRDAARADMEAAEQRMLGVLDGTFAVGDGSAQREIERLRTQLDAARTAARALVTAVDDLGSFADDTDPRVMATAGPIGKAQADLWLALGLSLDEEHARMQADYESRCAVCGWPLAASTGQGCTRGNCSYRPRPEKLYAPERARREADEIRERAQRERMEAGHG